MLHAFVNFRFHTAFLRNHYHQISSTSICMATSIGVYTCLHRARVPCEFFSRPVGVSSAHRGEFKKRLLSTDLDGGYGPGEPRGREPSLAFLQSLAMVGKFWRCLKQCRNIFKTFVWCFPANIWGSNSRSDFSGGLKAPTSNCTRPQQGPSGGQIQQTSRTGMELTWCFRRYLTQQK